MSRIKIYEISLYFLLLFVWINLDFRFLCLLGGGFSWYSSCTGVADGGVGWVVGVGVY